jgi:hypothetical protein
MRQTFRLLLTGSRTWDDTGVIEHALAVILARHSPGSATRSRRIQQTGSATAGPPGSSGTRR